MHLVHCEQSVQMTFILPTAEHTNISFQIAGRRTCDNFKEPSRISWTQVRAVTSLFPSQDWEAGAFGELIMQTACEGQFFSLLPPTEVRCDQVCFRSLGGECNDSAMGKETWDQL